MYPKSKIRYVCYRAKNNCILDKHKEILEYVEQFLGPEHKWDRFSVTWDILVDRKTGQLEIIKPEDDINYIHNTCLEAKILAKKGLSFDDFNQRQENIIKIVETHMLSGIMDWTNYGEVWDVDVSNNVKQITTKMINVKTSQIEVTEEMIEASKRYPDEIPDRPTVSESEIRDATPEEIEKIREKMSNMGVDTPEPTKKATKKKTTKKKTKKKTTKKKTKKK
jgi:hypothetical protein